jgi:hypothetical protein
MEVNFDAPILKVLMNRQRYDASMVSYAPFNGRIPCAGLVLMSDTALGLC